MSNDVLDSAYAWYVIHTHLRQEERADSNLKAWDVETLAPKVIKKRYNEFTGKPTILVKPLFPRYIFARFKPSAVLHKVCYTRGVYSVIKFGDRLISIDDGIISIIRSRMTRDGFIKMNDEIKPGDEVMIKHGPLRGFLGIFERDMNCASRVVMLLNTYNLQARIVIDREWLKKNLLTAP